MYPSRTTTVDVQQCGDIFKIVVGGNSETGSEAVVKGFIKSLVDNKDLQVTQWQFTAISLPSLTQPSPEC
jgi:hypothetical protein